MEADGEDVACPGRGLLAPFGLLVYHRKLPEVAQQHEAREAVGVLPERQHMLEVRRSEHGDLIYDDQVVLCHDRGRFLQALVEEERAVAGVHVDVGVHGTHLRRQLPRREREQDPRSFPLPPTDLLVHHMRFAPIGEQDTVGSRGRDAPLQGLIVRGLGSLEGILQLLLHGLA